MDPLYTLYAHDKKVQASICVKLLRLIQFFLRKMLGVRYGPVGTGLSLILGTL